LLSSEAWSPPSTLNAVADTLPLKIASPPPEAEPTVIASTAIVEPILLANVTVSGTAPAVASVT
jgi:hypothetical protein